MTGLLWIGDKDGYHLLDSRTRPAELNHAEEDFSVYSSMLKMITSEAEIKIEYMCVV